MQALQRFEWIRRPTGEALLDGLPQWVPCSKCFERGRLLLFLEVHLLDSKAATMMAVRNHSTAEACFDSSLSSLLRWFWDGSFSQWRSSSNHVCMAQIATQFMPFPPVGSFQRGSSRRIYIIRIHNHHHMTNLALRATFFSQTQMTSPFNDTRSPSV